MTDFKNSFLKKWGIGYLILVIFFTGLIYVLQVHIRKQQDLILSAQQIQKQIVRIERETKVQLKQFCAEFDSTKLIPGITSDFYRSKTRENEELIIFIYHRDSLIFWNSNKIPLPENFTKEFKKQVFVIKTQNGWYHFEINRFGSFTGIGCFLIKHEYPFENDYLTNQFSDKINIPSYFLLSTTRNGVAVNSQTGAFLFSVNIDKSKLPGSNENPILAFLFFLAGSIFLLLFLYQVNQNISWLNNRKWLLLLVFCLEAGFLRFFQYSWKFPTVLYTSDLFAPAWYASSAIIPSLGDFVINVFLLSVVALAFYQNQHAIHMTRRRCIKNNFIPVAATIVLLYLSIFVIIYLINNLIINSSLPLNLQNIGALNSQSGYGFFILCGLLLSYWLFSVAILSILFPHQNGVKGAIAGYVIGLLFCFLFIIIVGWEENITGLLFFIVYSVFLFFCWTQKRSVNSLQSTLFFLCFFSVFTTYILNNSYQNKEQEKRKLFAVKLASHRDPLTEALFEQMDRKLLSDSVILNVLRQGSDITGNKLDYLEKHLSTKYFQNYWTKFNLQVTVCDEMKNLQVQPQGYLINCHEYFKELIRNSGESTASPYLFFMDYGFGTENYIVVIPGNDLNDNSVAGVTLYIELSSKTAFKDLGYPELLIDKSRISPPDLSEYSYGVFEQGKLIHSVGSYNYRLELSPYLIHKSLLFFTYDHYDHYYYRINNATVLLISKKQTSFFSKIAPFPYLFILFSIVTLIITGIIKRRYLFQFSPGSLRERLQLTMIGILLLTFLVIGVVLISNIISINKKKNENSLQEKSFSVLVEIQHKYGGLSGWQARTKEDLNDFFVKLSNVFFTDINFYDPSGILIASSRPQVFEQGLLSHLMNADAYKKLNAEKRSMLMHEETIGTLHYSSAYLPFLNEKNQLLGYVNLPYFSRQDELKKEISSILVTFTNIYILLILLGVVVGWGLSKYITSPLAMLAITMSRLRLGKNNEKITWKKDDEIGQLVKEYNRMVEALSESAERLAQSERESAWREMAKQVAHEIKNPLTPMKLNIQYLQKAWLDKAPDWDLRLSQFSKILIEQIDTLSNIASEFSDFAQMPRVVPEKIDLEKLIPFVIAQYELSISVEFSFSVISGHPIVLADKKQMIRVFTNLINNSIQAIGDHSLGKIALTVQQRNSHVIIQIKDNGRGIPENQTNLIFEPNFSTKTGGMGLGLAIVKGIIENMNGEIDFMSKENIGTTFTIKLPYYVEKEKD